MTAKSGFWSKQQRVIPYLIVVIALSLIVILQGLVLWQQKQHSSLEFLLFGLEGIALFNAISLCYLLLPSINYRQLAQAFTRHNNTAINVNNRLTKMQPLTQPGDEELDVLTGEMYWSEPLCYILGHDPRQSPPNLEDIFQPILPPEREYWKSLIQRSLTPGYAFSLEHSILCPNGTVRHVTRCSESIENQAGKVICLIGTARDITAQKQLEIVLPTSESRLHEILNTAFAAIFSFRVYRDRTWVYDYVSAGVEEIYGYTPAAFIATSTLWMSVIHPDERESVISLLCERFFASQPSQVEFPIKTKEGVTRWLARSTTARRDIAQDCWCVTAVDIDITERKRVEAERQQADQEVRQQMTLLRQAIDSIPHHLFIKDDQGHFILANRAAAEVHGTTPEQLIGHRETDFNPYLDAAWLTEITAINQSVMHDQRSQTLPDTQLISHAGETQWYQIHLTPYRSLDHQVRGLIGNALNVTDRKRLDLALQASEAQLSMTLNAAKASIISYRLYRDYRWEYLYISPGCEAILGYTAAAMITDPTLWQSRVVPEDWETVFLPILDDLFGERSLSLEYRFLHRDDEIRWISTGLTSQYDPETDTWVVTLVDIDISDRKRAEMALQESQRQYQTLVDSVESIVWEADPDTFQFTFVSPQAKRILGYPLAAWLEPNFWKDHVIPDDLEATCAYCQRCIESRQDHQFEYRMIAADGRIVWIQAIVKLVYEGPRLIKLVGLLLDISDRKQAETALWQSQQLLERILDSVPQAIFWKDHQSVYLGCNQNFADYAGIRHPAEIIGKTDHELPWRPQDTAYYRQTDREVMTTGAAQLHLVEQQHPADGNEIWIELSKVPLADAADHIVGILGTYEDITQRQTTEAALYYSEARLRAVFEQSTVGIAFMDLAGRFLEVNTAYATITGYSQAELLSMTCSEITHPDDREPCRPQIDQLINNDEQTSLYLEKRYRCKDGHDKWVSLNLSTIRVHHDQALSFLTSIAVDITDRKQTEQALVRQTAQEQAFNRVVQTIRNSLDLNTIFATAVQEAAHFLKIDRVSIVQYQPERQCWQHVMEHRGRDDIPDTTGLEISDRGNPFAAQLKRFEVVRWDNAQTITDAVNRPIAEKFPGSWLLMPLIVNGQIWGSFSLFKDEPQETFSDYQVELVQRLADQIAIAIQQSTLYSQLQAANQQLQYLATHDSLTKLTNRRYFDEQIIREWSRLIRTVDEAWLSLILCDIDYFKQYNDFYGHLQGDDCLIAVAQALSNGIQRPTDVITRYGGEEFAVILPDTDSTGAIHVVQQIQAVIAALHLPHAASPVATQITLSLGIACAHKKASARLLKTTDQTSDVLIQMADQALYEAKSQGRNRYEISTTRVSSG
ncbi:MAG: PAS domain S-box protein [Leptolyngbya sp. SIOISBB]|nr:PAS domain S-box protein [Leptolyngbya sp. SIOISBB]